MEKNKKKPAKKTGKTSVKHHGLLKITAIFFALIAIYFLLGGGWLIILGGSWYYFIISLGLFATAFYLWRQDGFFYLLYSVILIGTGLWSLWEVGLNWWSLVPRLWVFFVIGLLLLLPFYRRAISKHRLVIFLFVALVFITVIGVVSLFVAPGTLKGDIDNPPITRLNPAQVAGKDWVAFGGTNAGLHYSSLNQITPQNIKNLKEVWRIRTGDMPTPEDPVEITNENTPLKVNDTLYACTAHGWVLALEPETGKTLWKFDPVLNLEGAKNFRGWAHMTCRGLSYYDADQQLIKDPNSKAARIVKMSTCPKRLYLPTADARLIALDADTGELCRDFGDQGSVDLKRNIGPFTPGGYYSTSPALVTQNLVIVGGHVTDNESTNEPSGVVRAYDVATGKLIWNWDSGNPTETTPIGPNQHYTRNSPNVWSIMSADEDLGLVYLPLGNQTPDQYGPNRSKNAEKYAAGIVALELSTGKVRWNYQLTHHDLWDMDVGSQPVLVDLITQTGLQPVVIQPTKQGSLYVLNRLTGKPIVPIDEIPVPQGAVSGDWTSKTQPRSQLNLLPKPLTEYSMWGATPFDQLSCRIEFKSLRYDGQYTPPSLKGSLSYPGNVGVMNWPGVGVDPGRRLLFAPANYMAFVLKLVPRADVVTTQERGTEQSGLQLNLGAPYAVAIRPFLSVLGFPCQSPPWGDVAGVDLLNNRVAWRHPNGTSYDSTPIIPLPFPVGVPAMGGPLMTASGLAFMSGTLDQFIRGYEVETGKEIWHKRLPAGGQANPMTFLGKDNRQYIVLVVGGHGSFRTKMGDYIIAYALDGNGS